MKKKVYYLLLCTFLSTFCSIFTVFANVSTFTFFQQGSGDHIPKYITEYDTYGMQFNTMGSFSKLDVVIAQAQGEACHYRFRLFKWNKNFGITITGEPVFEQTFENYVDSGTTILSFTSQPSGEYLLFMDNIRYESNGYCALWLYPTSGQVRGFFNGYSDEIENNMDLMGSIYYDNEPTTAFGNLSDEQIDPTSTPSINPTEKIIETLEPSIEPSAKPMDSLETTPSKNLKDDNIMAPKYIFIITVSIVLILAIILAWFLIKRKKK